MLRRLSRQLNDDRDGIKLERKRSKRERISQFFRTKSMRRQKPRQHDEALTKAESKDVLSLQQSPVANETKITYPGTTSTPVVALKATSIKAEEALDDATQLDMHRQITTEEVGVPCSESSGSASRLGAGAEPTEETLAGSRSTMESSEGFNILTKEAVHAIFAGSPRFSIQKIDGRLSPTVSYPWDIDVKHIDATDSIPPSESSYAAATARIQVVNGQTIQNGDWKHQAYQVDAMETPSWMSAQGLEPGSIGFTHFVELPQADSLLTEVHYDEDSEEALESSRNKEFLQSNPERIGIRAVKMDLVYDRLIEIQDLFEAFQQSTERITILNNQTLGDMYGHLFGTFLTPPGYAGADVDPIGLHVQVLALLRILNLKGVWYDFSLVEWRIRLGQTLFTEPEPVPNGGNMPLWTERDILLLQISLACELLLRLDAVYATGVSEVGDQRHGDAQEIDSLSTRKTDWDLILARRFLENILVIKGDDTDALTPVQEKRSLLSFFSGSTQQEAPRSDIIFLPQQQTRQLSGLLHFAERIKWPTIDSILKALADKLGVSDQNAERTVQPASPSAWSFNPTTPSVVSVYGTPLQTPRSTSHELDDYFGRFQKPTVKRNTSSSLRIPLSNTILSMTDTSKQAVIDIGGWLSRSFLTGLVLPGEAISHFLISTILENDQSAMSALGDSADLYGGFVYNGKSWWSKSSVVGRVLACTEGARECMGWIHVDTLPQDAREGWHPIRSEQAPVKSRLTSKRDLIAMDSAALPASTRASVKSTDLVMPQDLEDSTKLPVRFVQWDLTPLNTDLIEDDTGTSLSAESDLYTPSVTFQSSGNSEDHVLTLTHEVQFVTSWPCYAPASTSIASPQHVAPRRSTAGTLSHTSSKRSVGTKLSRRNSHGFEPLLSHPPEAADPGPQRSHMTERDEHANSPILTGPVVAHPLHMYYQYSVIHVAQVLHPNFKLPFTTSASKSSMSSMLIRDEHGECPDYDDRMTVLVLDARASSDQELLARAWCAERGFHALIARVERTCLACCIREARGLAINVVIRVQAPGTG